MDNTEIVNKIADAIIEDLEGRKGVFDDLEPDMIEEIRGDLVKVIKRAIRG